MNGNKSNLLIAKASILMVICCLYTLTGKAAGDPDHLFRAAVIKVDITPTTPKQLLGYGSRLSDGVHDRIYHRIIVLDDGKSRFVLVSSELCLFSPAEYERVAKLLQQKTGIDPGHFWWSVTHTHSAPELGVPGLLGSFLGERYKHEVDTAYASFVEQMLLDGVSRALVELQPVRIGFGWGYSQANINRRAIDIDGKASLGLNPDGAVDRRIGVIRLEKKDGSPLALIANYPIHGTVLGPDNLKISGDVAGVVSDYVEEKTGAPLLFINGAAGNLAPIYSVYPSPESGHLGQFRVLLGDKIIEANNQILHLEDSVKLITGSINIESPAKKDLPWPPDLESYHRMSSIGESSIRLPVRFLKLTDELAIWSAPVELFCEISNEIRDRSPFPFTFYFGYTNGWLGYLPAEKEWPHGGYEVETVCPYTPEMESQLTAAVTAYLQGEMRSLPQEVPHAGKKNQHQPIKSRQQ